MNVISKHNTVKLDLIVKESKWAAVVILFRQTGCVYFNEEHINMNGEKYVRINDVTGPGYRMMQLLHQMNLLPDESEKEIDKNYILFTSRKGKKKYVQEDRKEIGGGSESGNQGEAGELAGHGLDVGVDGDGDGDRCCCVGDSVRTEEAVETSDHSDQ